MSGHESEIAMKLTKIGFYFLYSEEKLFLLNKKSEDCCISLAYMKFRLTKRPHPQLSSCDKIFKFEVTKIRHAIRYLNFAFKFVYKPGRELPK